ncbi:MAG: hypothetical protein ABGY41_01800 [Candidatus Poribacteria bacterium]
MRFRIATLFIAVAIVAGCSGKGANFTDLTAADQLAEVKMDLETTKASIAEGGDHYHCCIDPTCNWCALHMASCECGHALGEGKPVCPECVLGWRKGKGDMADVDAADVKSALTEGMSDAEGDVDEPDGGHDDHSDYH